jgi:hypothetical protein
LLALSPDRSSILYLPPGIMSVSVRTMPAVRAGSRFLGNHNSNLSNLNANSVATKANILSLYRTLLRTATRLGDYNFRLFAIRRTRWGFREHKQLADEALIADKYGFGLRQLEVLKRQVVLSELYPEMATVMEMLQVQAPGSNVV